MSGLTKEDVRDLDFVDAVELASDGTTTYITGATVVSTTASTKRVVLSGIDLVHDLNERAEPGDLITLSGTTGGADGTYTIDTVVDSVTLDVVETIVNSTGGTADFIHPPGAGKVGFDDTGLTNITADNVQDAIVDLDGAISGGGLTEAQHKALRQLIHFVETNSPGDGFGAGPYVSEVLPAGNPFPTSETWYTDSGKTAKICRWEGTYNANKTFATEKWIVYKSDGTNPAADATDTVSYSGVFETGRSRAVAVY